MDVFMTSNVESQGMLQDIHFACSPAKPNVEPWGKLRGIHCVSYPAEPKDAMFLLYPVDVGKIALIGAVRNSTAQ